MFIAKFMAAIGLLDKLVSFQLERRASNPKLSYIYSIS